jgi:calcineurin-like phosphoesterase family protein
MDKEIIKRWNNVVAKTDKIFVLGDFSFYGQEKTRQICAELHGDKTLILGNHDRHPSQWYRDAGFKETSRYPILYAERFILSHEPLEVVEEGMIYNIHGHTHANNFGTSLAWYNVCVEKTNYTPVLFSQCGSVKFFESYQKIVLDK